MEKPLFIIALLGLLVSGYLFIAYVTPIQIICGEDGGCHTVQASEYAAIFGIPTPAYGILFYAVLACLAAMWRPPDKSFIYPALAFHTAVGFAVSASLTYIEAFVIDAWCQWCVASAILATLAFLYVWLHPIKQWNSPQMRKSGSALS